MNDFSKIYPATPEFIQKLKIELSHDYSAVKSFVPSFTTVAEDGDTLTEYYERKTNIRIFGVNINGQTYPLVGTNPVYYFAGQKFYLPDEQLGSYVMDGVLIPYGINFMLGTYKDTSLLWVYPIDEQGLPTNEPAIARGMINLADADSNSTELVYTYQAMDSSGTLNSGFVFFVQTRHFDGNETDFVGIWSNDQGDGNGEKRSAFLAWDNNNSQWTYVNFGDLQLTMPDGNPPDFDILILPVIAPNIPDAVDEPVTINGLTYNGLFPNPVKDYARLDFALSKTENITIELVGTNGTLVKTLASKTFATGQHSIEFNTADVSAGSYLIVFRSASSSFAVKTVIVK